MEKYVGRAPEEKTEQLISTLDDIFFLQENGEYDTHFIKLLPKLYKAKYRPAYNNIVVMEDGNIKASVGLYPFEMNIGGKKIKVGGIGNVGVAKDSRNKGYMIESMNAALDIMKNDGTDIAILEGHKQRYEYFGFEPVGVSAQFEITARNIAYKKGKDYKTPLTAREVTAEDTELIKEIRKLNEECGMFAGRPADDYDDILRSWNSVPYAVFKGDEFRGYIVIRDGRGINEFKPASPDDAEDFILLALEMTGRDEIDFSIPPFDSALCEKMIDICGCYSVDYSRKTNVLNYKTFLEVCLGFKAKRIPLADGSLTILFHGLRKDEKLKITVAGGAVSVEETDGAADYEFAHLEGMRFIAGPFCPARDSLPAFAQAWFPVDYYSFAQDDV